MKINNSFIIFTCLFVIFSWQTFAQENAIKTENLQQQSSEKMVLTVEEAVNYAKENSRSLKSANIDLQIKKRAKNFSWNVLVPSVQATGTMSRSNEVTNTMDAIISAINPMYQPAEIEPSDHWKAIGGLTASLNLSVALIDGIRASFANYEAGLITWEQTYKETELNIRKMFYALLLQQESLNLQKTTLANAKNRFDQAKINFRNGLIPELSLLQTEVTYENQKPAIVKQEQALKEQLDTFAFLLGIPQGTEISLSGEITPDFVELNPQELYQKYMENNLEIALFKKNLEMMKINYSAQNLQIYTPAVSLSYGWQPVLSDITSDWSDKDNWFDNGSFSVTLAWNITNMLPFSASSLKVQDLKNNIEQMNLNLINLEENAKMKINNLVNVLNQSRAAIESSNRNISLAQKSYDMTSIAYRNGTTELLDVREAETQLNQAKLALASEKFNYLAGLLDLEFAINSKLTK